MYKLIHLIVLLLLIPFNPAYSADKLLDYGFEDWGGSVENTSNYIFGTGYASYCNDHQNASEVVSSYNGLTPFSGNRFWLLNHSDYPLNPSVSGITAGAINPRNNIGLGPSALCSSNPFVAPQNPTELYISFRFAASGWENITTTDSKLKLVRFYDADAGEPILMVLKNASTGAPMWSLLKGSSYHYGPDQPNLFDGNWHKISYYVNYVSGDMYVWCDVENESLQNATYHAQDVITSNLDTIDLINNWSAHNPTGPVWHALDDIEVWDGFPESDQGSTDNTPSIFITSPTQNSIYESSEPSITLQGIANDDYALSSVSWMNSTGYQGTVSGGLESWATGSIPLQEGQNQITVTATDNNSQTSSDTLTVTYMPGDNNLAWSAADQTGDSTWDDSSRTWCVRVLLEGSSIVNEGGQVILGFQGRNSGSYSIRKVSIAEKDPNGNEGDVVNSTWTQITFDGNDTSTWETDSTTITAGVEKLSDAVPFAIEPNKDYYVTFITDAPSAYLLTPSYYTELYFEGADHTTDVDWSNTGFSNDANAIHALSAIYVLEGDGGGNVIAIPGIPGSPQILID